eukprot:CAMPEP_0196727628 /NCGR_PEP_ID=MMETSP1091-20130531/8572_1 /TAXON_ID=302021 /ORGANISM="Rhodomonas sp., Strain CCMP768" /LENGTH=42 /DNA_ID= /DNA_START= /DNA_END= /DNA_ORIENTATION=
MTSHSAMLSIATCKTISSSVESGTLSGAAAVAAAVSAMIWSA